MTQGPILTNDQKVAAAFLPAGSYLPTYPGHPKTTAGFLWGHDYTRPECWVEGTAIAAAAHVGNLAADVGAPDNGQLNIHAPNALTYVDQGSGAASGFQIAAAQDNGNLIQIDPGTGMLQTSMTDDFYFSTTDVYPDTSALDNGKFLLSKCTTPITNAGSGLFICRAHGQTGGASAVRIDVRCSDSVVGTADIVFLSAAPIGQGKGLHTIGVARIAGIISVFYDGVLLGSTTNPLTFSANSIPLCHGGRVTGGAANQILGLKMIADYGVDLTLAAAALGISTSTLVGQIVGWEWGYMSGKFGAFT